MERVLVMGEALLDVVRTDGRTDSWPGGSAANVAVALARLGRGVGLATCLGRDEAGQRIATHLAESGVELVGDPWRLECTSTAVATTGADGSATYDFDLEWRPGPVGTQGWAAIHVGSIGAVLDPGAAVVRDLVSRAAGRVLVSYDINARPTITGVGPEVVDRVERLVALADVVKVSDEDLAVLWPGGEEAAVTHLRHLGARSVVLTRGAHGARWYGDGGVIEVPAVPVTVVDTIGAGDTFAAALLDGLLDLAQPWAAEDLVPVLDRATLAAALNVSRAGASPPTAAEIRQGGEAG